MRIAVLAVLLSTVAAPSALQAAVGSHDHAACSVGMDLGAEGEWASSGGELFTVVTSPRGGAYWSQEF